MFFQLPGNGVAEHAVDDTTGCVVAAAPITGSSLPELLVVPFEAPLHIFRLSDTDVPNVVFDDIAESMGVSDGLQSPLLGKAVDIAAFDADNNGEFDVLCVFQRPTQPQLWMNDGAGRLVDDATKAGLAALLNGVDVLSVTPYDFDLYVCGRVGACLSIVVHPRTHMVCPSMLVWCAICQGR